MMCYYKPKIFRNSNGCCICRTKSSSSRFTDSIKYEPYFENCFRLMEKRTGDICNACVLVIKRWKKLPNDTDRHWNHAVDSRAGPRVKSMNKYKSKPSPSLASEDLASTSALTIKDEFSPTTHKYKSKLKPKRRVTSIPSRRLVLEDLASTSTLTIKDELSPTTHKYESKLKPNRRVTSIPRRRLVLEDLASTSTLSIKDEFSPTTHKYKSKPSPSLASEDLASTSTLSIKDEFSPTIHKYESKPSPSLASEDLASTSTLSIKDEFSPTTHKYESKPSPSLASEDLASTPVLTTNDEFSLTTSYDSLYQSYLLSRQRSDSPASHDNVNGDTKTELSEKEINAIILLTHWKMTQFKEE